jgi:hypothetical protein
MTTEYEEAKSDVIRHALRQITDNAGRFVTIKPKALTKFGKNTSIGTSYETVWLIGGHETYVSTNIIDTVSSTDATDTQDMKIEGHTVDGSGNFTFSVQSVTLNGQNKVVLSTPLARATRLYNDDNTDLAGTVYVYEDTAISGGAPTDMTKAHLVTGGDNNQSLKCSTTISSSDYWIITQLTCGVDEKTTAAVDFGLQIRAKDKVFRTVYPLQSSRGSDTIINLNPAIIVYPNSDVRMIAKASAINTSAEATIGGYLAQ